jgi:hypothetical protein
MAPSQRRCSTCRHFQPAPLWRKGWCRNPLLYAPHQNHLVDERDLDCNRGMGDYWEPAEIEEEELAIPAAVPATAPTTAPVRRRVPVEPAESAAIGAEEDEAPPAPARPAPPRRPARRQGDYLRLATPAAVILVLLAGYTIWTGVLFSSAATSATPTAIIQPTQAAAATPTSLPAATPTVAASPSPSPTNPPPPTATQPAAATLPPANTPAPAELRPGGVAVVDTQGLRFRREPGSQGAVIRALRPGERLVLIEGPLQESGQAWWKVEANGTIGWVAAAFIKPAS